MIIIPAIDIRKGNVVRLLRGSYHRETIYSHEPIEVAKQWKDQGAELIHIVDLEGAFWGKPKNLKIVEEIIKQVKIKVHMGGGLRSLEDIKNAFNLGVNKVVMSTKIFEDEKFLTFIEKDLLKKIIVSIDSKDGFVRSKGWTQETKITVQEAIKKVEKTGCEMAVVTDISTDGTLSGPNIALTKDILRTTTLQIIASGGISKMEDIINLKQLGFPNLYGVIIGKALYEKKINLREAINHAKN